MLHIPLSDDHFVLQTDASGKGVAGVLCVFRQGLELLLVFFFRQLRCRYRAGMPGSTGNCEVLSS